MSAGKYRHHVTVMGPAGSRGTRGEVQGQPVTVLKDWPCSITPLGGSETDEAGGTNPQMNYQIEGYGSRLHPFFPSDWLVYQGRKLHIASIEDVNMNGTVLRIICGEEIKRG